MRMRTQHESGLTIILMIHDPDKDNCFSIEYLDDFKMYKICFID